MVQVMLSEVLKVWAPVSRFGPPLSVRESSETLRP